MDAGLRRYENGEGLVAGAGRAGAEAAPDYRVERLAAAGRGAVETADVAPVAGCGEMLRMWIKFKEQNGKKINLFAFASD